MAKITVKDFRKQIDEMLDKHTNPPEINPIDKLIEASKKTNGMMN